MDKKGHENIFKKLHKKKRKRQWKGKKVTREERR